MIKKESINIIGGLRFSPTQTALEAKRKNSRVHRGPTDGVPRAAAGQCRLQMDDLVISSYSWPINKYCGSYSSCTNG